MIRFVIPAAGSAVRFGGIPKELLPISETDCGLTHAVRLARQLGGCDPIVVTTADKSKWHCEAIVNCGLSAEMIVKEHPEQGDMWGSVLLGMDRTMPGGLILPDSVATVASPIMNLAAINFGCFVTETPWRFSCMEFTGGPYPNIRTKPQIQGRAVAWGMVQWDTDAAKQLATHPVNFDKAFEAVMQDRGHGIFILTSYHDLGSFQHYRDYLDANRNPDNNTQEVRRPADVPAADG